MRAVIQRVSRASVACDGDVVGEIGQGLLVLLGVAATDAEADLEYIVQKSLALRIFPDEAGKMNLSVADVKGELLIVSQFTLNGDARKGRRPAYDEAAPPQVAEPLYLKAIRLFEHSGLRVQTGRFRAHMDVELVNDGPVTLLLDSGRAF